MQRMLRLGFRAVATVMFLFIGCLAAQAQVPSNCHVGTNVYYISSSTGSDSNTQAQAKSKSTPWAHSPYMADFAGTYASGGDDCFFFKGGDSWSTASFQMKITNGGNSDADLMYFGGGDQTWFTGASWTPPILDLTGYTNNDAIQFWQNYVQFDNWETKNQTCNGSGDTSLFANTGHAGIFVTYVYSHKFNAPVNGGAYCGTSMMVFYHAGGCAANGGTCCDGGLDHDIVDGSDAANGTGQIVYATKSGCLNVTHSIFHDVCSAVNMETALVAYNLIYDIGNWSNSVLDCVSISGNHPDGIQTATNSDIHDNVIYNCVGEIIQVTPHTGQTSHIYNNVLFKNFAGGAIEAGTGGDGGSGGEVDVYNNTIDCATGNDAGSCVPLHTYTISFSKIIWENNHLITGDGQPGFCIANLPYGCNGSTTVTTLSYTPSSELEQTLSQAAAHYASDTATYAYAPLDSSAPGIGKGMNLTGSCTTSLVLCTDTAYGSAQSGAKITVPRVTVGRPGASVGNWDAGGYQFSGQSAGPPGAAAALKTTVQ